MRPSPGTGYLNDPRGSVVDESPSVPSIHHRPNHQTRKSLLETISGANNRPSWAKILKSARKFSVRTPHKALVKAKARPGHFQHPWQIPRRPKRAKAVETERRISRNQESCWLGRQGPLSRCPFARTSLCSFVRKIPLFRPSTRRPARGRHGSTNAQFRCFGAMAFPVRSTSSTARMADQPVCSDDIWVV